MTERSILAYFHSEEQAKGAANKLKGLGVVDLQIDFVSPYPGGDLSDLDNPIAEPISSLSSVVLDSSVSGRDAGILIAANPDASGMADGSGLERDRNVLLTVVLQEKDLEKARTILEQEGALL